MTARFYVLTISDSAAAGVREDRSGPAVQARLRQMGWAAEVQVLPDEHAAISHRLRQLADSGARAIFTTGGTGIASRDVTPEATREVIEREVPGLAEWMRIDGRRHTPRALLSRGLAGVRGQAIIINLPGSPAGAVQSLESIADLLPHIVDLLEGRTEHPPSGETAGVKRTSQE